MAFNFPSSPTNGQSYTSNGVTYTYDSTYGVWKVNPIAVPDVFSTSNAAFVVANAAFGNANSTLVVASAAFGLSNTVNTFAYGVSTNTTAAFNLANNNLSNVTAAFGFANGVSTNTTAAFAKANAALANTTTTLNGTLTTTGGATIQSELSIKKISETPVALGSSGTSKTIDLGTGTVFTTTLTGDCTFTLSNVTASKAASFSLIMTNDASAGRAVAWSGGTFKYPSGSLTRTTTGNAVDIWTGFTPDGGTTWYLNIPMKNIS